LPTSARLLGVIAAGAVAWVLRYWLVAPLMSYIGTAVSIPEPALVVVQVLTPATVVPIALLLGWLVPERAFLVGAAALGLGAFAYGAVLWPYVQTDWQLANPLPLYHSVAKALADALLGGTIAMAGATLKNARPSNNKLQRTRGGSFGEQ